MGYREKVLEKIRGMEQRSDERESLWQSIIQSFEREKADGVTNELAGLIGKGQERFDALLEKLKRWHRGGCTCLNLPDYGSVVFEDSLANKSLSLTVWSLCYAERIIVVRAAP